MTAFLVVVGYLVLALALGIALGKYLKRLNESYLRPTEEEEQ